MKRILFLSAKRSLARLFWPEECFLLAEQYGFSVEIPAWESDCSMAELLAGDLTPYSGFLTAWDSPCCDGKLLARAPNLRMIGHLGGSTAVVADDSTFARGVRVSSCNTLMAHRVVEWSLMATLMAARNFLINSYNGRENRMVFGRRLELADTASLTVGIWGLGTISRELLNMLAPIRFRKILIFSEHAAPELLAALGAEAAPSLSALFRESNIVHLLAGATAKNLGRVGRMELEALKPGSTLINAGRARLVQEDALMNVLRRGEIRAMLDVFYQEPLPPDHELFRLPNVFCTPHDAGTPGMRQYAAFMLEEFRRFYAGEPLAGEINAGHNAQMTDERLWKQPV